MNALLQNLLQETVTKGLSDKIGSSLGVSSSQASSVISMLMPAVMGGLQNNATDSNEAEKIAQTIEKNHSSGDIFNHLSDLVSNPSSQKGDGILEHILGSQRNTVEQQVATKSGVDSSTVSKIFTMVAPLVMGQIGKEATNSSTNTASFIGDLLGAGKQSNTQESSLLTSLLDSDNDGSIMDDVLGMGMKFLTKA